MSRRAVVLHGPTSAGKAGGEKNLPSAREHALSLAKEAAGGLDVRIGGGASTVSEFLQADPVDFLDVVIVPVVLGCGVRIWGQPTGLEDKLTVESIGMVNGLTHQLWNGKDRT